MRAAALGMVLLCLVSGCTKAPKAIIDSICQAIIDSTSKTVIDSTSKTVIDSTSKTVTNSIGMELIDIPAGKFMMGSPAGEKGRTKYNEEQVAVTLTKPFGLGKTEVTRGQWQQVMGTEPWDGKYDNHLQADKDSPATYVNWNEAATFCQKLTDLERMAGKLKANEAYRLPTEAEWEYACRAGTTTAYSFGDDESKAGEYAWFKGNTKDVGDPHAHKVGMKKPNPWGLYDMHGNVKEWCSDWADAKISGGTDPVGPEGGLYRRDRGGSAGVSPSRSALRGSRDPSVRWGNTGFRVARSQSAQ